MITNKQIEKLLPKSTRYTVKIENSLYLRITPSGYKSYVFRYYSYGKTKDITLGAYPFLSSLQATQLAHLKRKELEIKPSQGITLGAVYKLWKTQKRTIKSYKAECTRIENNLMTDLKHIEVDKFLYHTYITIYLNLSTLRQL